jgi:hypothetical protein
MKKLVISISLYIVVCNLVIYAIRMEYEQRQPVGLLVVGMAFIPIIITIFGGLPLDCVNKEKQGLTATENNDLA